MISKLSYFNLCLSITCAKFLFLPSYLSTDFDVHRNWLAITYNLPIDKWYFDTTSEWTLDYPPLFALFEYLLSQFAGYFDLNIVKLSKDPIRTESVILFQRISVILSDLLYYYAVYTCCKSAENSGYWKKESISSKNLVKKKNDTTRNRDKLASNLDYDENGEKSLIENLSNPSPSFASMAFLLLQPGLLIVDHIHFQYNAFLTAYLLMSISCIINRHYVKASLWFLLLLNLKHIYLYGAPAYVLYLLFNYCLRVPENDTLGSLARLAKLATVVIVVFVTTYFPYGNLMQMSQIFTRLFPFKRGLSHAYWAPNIWSIYNLLDKLLNVFINKGQNAKSNMSAGLVGPFEHSCLPAIKPWMTFFLVVAFNVYLIFSATQPIVFKLWSHRGTHRSSLFIRALVLCSFTSFQFGWHVHEKAILIVLLPLGLLSFTDETLAKVFLRLSLVGTYSLFPLLYKPGEWLTKILLLAMYQQYITKILGLYHAERKPINLKESQGDNTIFRVMNIDQLYLMSVIVVEIYATCIHGSEYFTILRTLSRFEFLPLMLVSVYSAIGITFSYLQVYYEFMLSSSSA